MEKTNNKKLRILYTNGHETLTDVQVPLLLNAGFEVVKSLVNINYQSYFMHTPKYDNQTLEINQLWRKSCTLPEETIAKIQNLDFMNFYHVKGGHHMYNTSWKHFSEEDKELINENIDVIFIGPFFYRVSMLEWFKGICVMNIYGLENDMSTWKRYNTGRSMAKKYLQKYNRWISTLFFQSTMELESSNPLGKNGMVLTSVTSEAIVKKVQGFTKWNWDNASKTVATNMTIHKGSRKNQMLFARYFKDFDHIIYGKNKKEEERNIRGHIDDYKEMFAEVVQCGVFVDSSLVKSHGRYFAVECMALGMPTLFLKDTVFGSEGIEAVGITKMLQTGMCLSYPEMIERAKKCLDDKRYAQSIIDGNQIIFDEVFLQSRGNTQAEKLYTKCETLLQKPRLKSLKSFWSYFLPQSS